MTFRAKAGIALAALAALGTAALVQDSRSGEPPPIEPRAPAERPELMLLTSLPIVFAEGFGLEGGGSAALKAMESRYRVRLISIADAGSLNSGRLLLMAHPLAQPAEALVELDAWVRSGGRVLLLADPRLEWAGERPLGDPLRPPPAFADTGLLRHWGLTLYAPEKPGRSQRSLDGRQVAVNSAGELERSGNSPCAIAAQGLVARCTIGRGKATVIADADFLGVDDGGRWSEKRVDPLLAELARLEKP